MTRRVVLLACAGAIPLLWALLSAPAAPVFAHARLKSSTPAIGEPISAQPTRVEIAFTEEIQQVSGTYEITVVKDRGLDVTMGPAATDPSDRTRLVVPLQTGLGNGRYVVKWKNVSDADGDAAEGAFSFYLNYRPNAVDLANDAQLAQIGGTGATPGANATAPSSATASVRVTVASSPGATAPPVATAAATARASAATASATATASDNGGSSNRTQWIVAGIAIAVIVVIALGGWRIIGRRG